MRELLYTTLAATLCLAGCGEKQAPVPPASTTKPALQTIPVPPPMSEATPPPPPPGTRISSTTQALPKGHPYAEVPGAKDEDGLDIGLTKINDALKQFIKDTERLPASLEELVKSGVMYRLPVPPPGKKYTIDQKTKRAVIVNK